MQFKAAMQQLQIASSHPLDADAFAKFTAIDWRDVCFAKDGELDSINQLCQALITQIAFQSARVRSLTTNVIAPFFLGDKDNNLPNISATEKFMFEKLHSVIPDICKSCPRSSATICRSLCTAFPFYGTCSPHSYVTYVWNLLSISPLLQASEEKEVILFVLDRIYLLDVNTDVSDPGEELQHIKLEHSVEQVICFIKNRISAAGEVDASKALELYDIVFPAYAQTICPSSKPLQSMFWMFYLASMSDEVAPKLCHDLWHVYESGIVDPVVVLGLVTSFSTRSMSVTSDQVVELLTKLANVCHSYIENVSFISDAIQPEKHILFYAAFQSIVFLIVIRSNDFPDPKILQILQLSKLVTSQLLPLSVCPEAIAEAFARTTSQLHITSTCDTRTQHLVRDGDTVHDLVIKLHYHSEPLNMIKRRIEHLLRPIVDPDVSMTDAMVKSLSYEKRWSDAAALDFNF